MGEHAENRVTRDAGRSTKRPEMTLGNGSYDPMVRLVAILKSSLYFPQPDFRSLFNGDTIPTDLEKRRLVPCFRRSGHVEQWVRNIEDPGISDEAKSSRLNYLRSNHVAGSAQRTGLSPDERGEISSP